MIPAIAYLGVGAAVLLVVYRWRPELKAMVLEQAMRFGNAMGVAFLWFSVLLAAVWPVVLFAAIRRHIKYGDEEGPV